MKRIVLESPRKFSVEEIEIPKPNPGQVLVKIKKVGVCASDMHLYRQGYIGDIWMDVPLVIGHECMGEVVAMGGDVSEDMVGLRVAVDPAISCGKCKWCTSGKTNLCPEVLFLGLPPKSGALQEYIVHPADLLEKLPNSISDEGAVVLEPMSIALHGINLVKIKPGQSVVILGTGVLGTCVLDLLGLHRGLHVICVDLLPERLERAEKMGAEKTIRAEEGKGKAVVNKIKSATRGEGAEVVFECAGVEDTLWNMCEIAAPGAHVAVIGTNPDDRLSFSSGSARRKGLTLRFVRRSLNTLSQCIRLADQGRISPADLVTHTFSPAEVNKAFETVDSYADGVLKAIIDMEKW